MQLRLPRFLLGRLYLLASVLAVDCALLASTPHAAPLLGPLAPLGIVTFAVFLGLGYRRLGSLQEILSFRSGLFAAHIACIGGIALLNIAASFLQLAWTAKPAALAAAGVVIAAGVVLLALACIPFRAWIEALRVTSPSWVYALAAGIAAWFLRSPFQSLWIHSSESNVYWLQVVAFRAVEGILGFLLPDLVVDSGPFILGTPRFTVSIGAPCSGIEGLGLVLVFTTIWLWFFRKEMRFPQALLLVPCALISVFALNIVRIAVLILIGNAGAPEVAFVGFHSQAGWIAFTLVALGFSMAAQRLNWIRKEPVGAAVGTQNSEVLTRGAETTVRAESPATAAYLIPFLAIIGASFVAKSASGHFEWLYPLRFIAALVALWMFRAEYRKLNWRCGWLAPLAGAGIFAVWIGPDLLAHDAESGTLGASLQALPIAARITWIAFRVAAAVITVPIAEELAFRGYLARRIMNRDFTAVSFAQLSLVSVGLSSIAFGSMHGQHWFVGVLAGLAFALLARMRASIGDAVVAHAVANLLLAVWVLSRGAWGLW